MFRLAKLSLANRSVVALITVIIAIFGVISLGSLRQELFPSIEVPQAAIVTTYPGANPKVVDEQVSRPIETAVSTLDGVSSTSTTSQANISIVRVTFDYGTTTADVKQRLTSAIAGLTTIPSSVKPTFLSGSLDNIPVIALGIYAKDGDNKALSKVIENIATPILSKVNGIRDVSISGIKEMRINVKLNDKKLAKYGLTRQSVVTALQSNGFVIPAGSIVDSKGELTIQAGSQLNSVADFANLPVIGTKTITTMPSTSSLGAGAAPTSGYPSSPAAAAAAAAAAAKAAAAAMTPTVSTKIYALHIKDIAKVSYVESANSSISRVNGHESLGITMTKTQDGNTVSISHDVAALLPDLAAKLGNVEIVTVFDQAPFVEKSLESLNSEGLLGLGFAIVVILIFLLSVRSTLVTAISIPTSVLITFIGLNTAGYSLNLFTLSALTIAIGRVVDDSIVVIENINRHLSYGEPKKKAVLSAVKEVASAITAATITTVAVFLPIALVGGLVGQLFRPFAFTFAIALVASLVVSLTIVPVLAYWFMKGSKNGELTDPKAAKKAAEVAREAEEAKERKSWLQRGYLPVLKTTQAHPVITLVAAFFVLVLTFGLVPLLKTNFIGNSDSTSFVMNQELPSGSSLTQKSEAAAKVETILLGHKEITSVLTSIGSTGDGRVAFGAAAGGIQIQVATKDGVDQAKLKAAITAQTTADKTLGKVTFQAGGGSFGSSDTIDVKITGTTDAAIKAGIDAVTASMQGIKNVSEITNSLKSDQRTLSITVNRLKAAKLGLSEVAITSAVAAQMNPTSIGNVNVEDVSTPIYITVPKQPKTVAQIKNIKIATMTGSVRLSKIASVREVLVPTTIASEKGDRTANVSLKPVGDNIGAITADATKRLAKADLPAGVTASLGGVSKDQADSFGQLGLALLAAIAIVYVVMVATFRSILQPILLLTSIPFAATGAFIALLATDTPLGVPALIGMLLLVGIVVTNAIVLIDLINQYVENGMKVKEAILNGARQRLRPILMTALATIFALTPMSLGVTGGGGFISKPLAVVVIGGLFSSTVLTLVIVPVLYWLVAGRKERKAARLERKASKPARKAAKTKTA